MMSLFCHPLAIRSCASSVLKIVKDEKEHDDLEHSMIQVARCIKHECKEMKFVRTHDVGIIRPG